MGWGILADVRGTVAVQNHHTYRQSALPLLAALLLPVQAEASLADLLVVRELPQQPPR